MVDNLNSIIRMEECMTEQEVGIITKMLNEHGYKRILNIGTSNGYTVLEIEKRIHNAYIYTVDILYDDDVNNMNMKDRYSIISYNMTRNRMLNASKDDRERFAKMKDKNIFKDKVFREYLLNNNIKNIISFNNGSDSFFENYNGDKIDAVIIDGDHSYFQSKNDLYNSLKIVRDGGLIFMHDLDEFGHEDDKKYWLNKKSCYDVFNEIQENKEIFDTKCKLGVIYV